MSTLSSRQNSHSLLFSLYRQEPDRTEDSAQTRLSELPSALSLDDIREMQRTAASTLFVPRPRRSLWSRLAG